MEGDSYKGPKDVLAALRLDQIGVMNEVDGCEGYVIHLCFWAKFEPEHGIGVLTDGHKVLGTGYMMEATPYGYRFPKATNGKVRK